MFKKLHFWNQQVVSFRVVCFVCFEPSDPFQRIVTVYSKNIGVNNVYISDLSISVTLGHVNFVTPHYKSMVKNLRTSVL